MQRRLKCLAGFAAALLIGGVAPALGDDHHADETAAKTQRPTTLDRPIGLKPQLLSPAGEQPAPSDKQRAVDYRSNLQGEIKRLERRHGERRSRRAFDRGQAIRRERSRIDRAIRR